MLFAPKVAKIAREQFAAAHATPIIVQIVMHDVGVLGVHARVFGLLILAAVAGIVLVEDVVVIDQSVGRAGEAFFSRSFSISG